MSEIDIGQEKAEAIERIVRKMTLRERSRMQGLTSDNPHKRQNPMAVALSEALTEVFAEEMRNEIHLV